ncbi:hypothetical protein Mh1950_13320 [Mannheimia haemolytica]|nr:hypothetical protein B824_25140 [Mannheimia haemolytica USDA-ARS-USMARC-184]
MVFWLKYRQIITFLYISSGKTIDFSKMKPHNDNILAQSKLEQECYSEDKFYTKNLFLDKSLYNSF